MPKILDLQTTDDPRDFVHLTVQALAEGQVVGVPTDTVYGLAAHALCEDAVRRLCEIKGRGDNAPLAISVRSREAAGDFFCQPSGVARTTQLSMLAGPAHLGGSL